MRRVDDNDVCSCCRHISEPGDANRDFASEQASGDDFPADAVPRDKFMEREKLVPFVAGIADEVVEQHDTARDEQFGGSIEHSAGGRGGRRGRRVGVA